MTESEYRDTISAFITSLTDYSTDQRGDIGSWVRLVTLTALGKTTSLLAKRILSDYPEENKLVNQESFDLIVGGIVKQSVEKLEPLREEGRRVLQILKNSQAGDIWDWQGLESLDVDFE